MASFCSPSPAFTQKLAIFYLKASLLLKIKGRLIKLDWHAFSKSPPPFGWSPEKGVILPFRI